MQALHMCSRVLTLYLLQGPVQVTLYANVVVLTPHPVCDIQSMLAAMPRTLAVSQRRALS